MNKQYAICINNDGYAASLELRKVYQLLQDANAKKLGLLRVIDESGEDYLYAQEMFRAIHARTFLASIVSAMRHSTASPTKYFQMPKP